MSEFDLLARLRAGQRAFEHPVCSRAACERSACHRIEWRNPRIHSEERIKIWLACDEHLDYLHDFLHSRSLPVRVHAIGDEIDEEPIR